MTIDMYDEELRVTYEELTKQAHSFQIEPFAIVESVHKYRMYWKPEKVKTLLLAESHVATSPEEHTGKHTFNGLADYPENFVRFVYCLSYGDNGSLTTPCAKNSGTPQFWTLFNETVSENFRVINNPDPSDKRAQKIALLEEMKRCSIWLLDCSITGVYVPTGQSPNSNEYDSILTTSFDKYCKPILEAEKPERIIVIGKRVNDLLESRLPASSKNLWIHQPNAKLSKEKKRTLSTIGY